MIFFFISDKKGATEVYRPFSWIIARKPAPSLHGNSFYNLHNQRSKTIKICRGYVTNRCFIVKNGAVGMLSNIHKSRRHGTRHEFLGELL